MSVSITLPDDLEQFSQRQARLMGVPVETLLACTIVERWQDVNRISRLPNRETEFLARLQTLFPFEQTREYQDLCRRSDTKSLTESERERLLVLVEPRDEQNADRLTIAAELANLRGLSLREVMVELGIRPD